MAIATQTETKRNRKSLTAERLRDIFDYDALTGHFVYKRAFNRPLRCIGKRAGYSNEKTRYERIRIDGKLYLSHRLAWLHFYGRWPVLHLDHINGDGVDNRIENLREATVSQNLFNAVKNNRTGFPGVYRVLEKFGAAAVVNGKKKYLGLFDTAERAHEAYRKAISYRGEFLPKELR